MGNKQVKSVIDYAEASKICSSLSFVSSYTSLGDPFVLFSAFVLCFRPKVREPGIQALRQKFQSLQAQGKIEKAVFIREILIPRIGRVNDAILDRFFQVLDHNSSGFIEFEDFVPAMYMFQASSREERLRCLFLERPFDVRDRLCLCAVIFNLFDIDATEQIAQKNFKKIETALLQSVAAPSQWSQQFDPLIDFMVKTVFEMVCCFAFCAAACSLFVFVHLSSFCGFVKKI